MKEQCYFQPDKQGAADNMGWIIAMIENENKMKLLSGY